MDNVAIKYRWIVLPVASSWNYKIWSTVFLWLNFVDLRSEDAKLLNNNVFIGDLKCDEAIVGLHLVVLQCYFEPDNATYVL